MKQTAMQWGNIVEMLCKCSESVDVIGEEG